jgi:hypothetical protein
MKCSVAILLLSFVVFASAIGIGRKQRVHATGKLVCDGKAMGKVTVKLYGSSKLCLSKNSHTISDSFMLSS